MLTEAYIKALLVDEELADWVWEDWNGNQLDDEAAWNAWLLIVRENEDQQYDRDQ